MNSPHNESAHIESALNQLNNEGRLRFAGKLANQARRLLPDGWELDTAYGDRGVAALIREMTAEQNATGLAAAQLLRRCLLVAELETVRDRDIRPIAHWYAGLGESDREAGEKVRSGGKEGHEKAYGDDNTRAERRRRMRADFENAISNGEQRTAAAYRIAKLHGYKDKRTLYEAYTTDKVPLP